MRIDMGLATNDDWGRRRAPPKQLKDPPPEKYSVEWRRARWHTVDPLSPERPPCHWSPGPH